MTGIDADSILAELRGQCIVLPDLNGVLNSWPKQTNRNLDRLRHDVDEWLDRYKRFPATAREPIH